MDHKKTQKFEQKLLDLRSQLQALEQSMADAGKTVELDQARVGRLSRMDAMQGQQMAIEAGRRRRLQLAGIGAALKRIESGDYGLCLGCDEEIDVRRLEADPSSSLCIACAEKEQLK